MNSRFLNVLQPLLLSAFVWLMWVPLAASQDILYEVEFNSAQRTTWTNSVLKGNAAYDTFSNCPIKYTPLAPIDKNCLFFEVYSAGEKEASNGDGLVESSMIMSPQLNVLFKNQTWVQFDYQFIKLRSPVVSLLVSTDTGKTWKRIWRDSLGSMTPATPKIRIDQTLSLGSSSISFRLHWQTTDTNLHQGYVFFDNFMIYNVLPKDIAVRNTIGNSKEYCKTGQIQQNYQVVNKGYASIGQHRVIASLYKNTSLLVVQTDTFTNFNPGDYIFKNLPVLFGLNSGFYRWEIKALSTDDNVKNDSVHISFYVGDSLAAPTAINGSRCGFGSVDLAAYVSKGKLSWFERNGTQPLAEGTFFETPSLSKTDTFEVRTTSKKAHYVHTGQGPYRFNSAHSGGAFVRLIAKKDLRIKQLGQHFANADSSTVQIFIKKGGYRGFENKASAWLLNSSNTIETDGWGSFEKLEVNNAYALSGDTISFYITGTGKSHYTFKKGEVNIDNESFILKSDVITDKSFSTGSMLFPGYSWDGYIEVEELCFSDPALVEAKITWVPEGSFLLPTANFIGEVNDGTASNPDQVGNLGKAAYTVIAPSGFSYSSYGSTWKVDDVVVQTQTGAVISNSFYNIVQPSGNKAMYITFNPQSQWTDDHVSILVRIKDLINTCDTTILRIVRVSAAPKAAFSLQSTPCLNQNILFTNTTQSAYNCTYQWSFDDGSTSSKLNPTHVFKKAITHEIRLVATSALGIKDTFVMPLKINGYAGSSIRVIHSCLGVPAEIQNTSENAQLVDAKYLWLYQTDTILVTASTLPFQHGFGTIGVHKIRLIADHKGCIDSSSKNVFQFANPVAKFDWQGDCQYEQGDLINSSSIENNDNIGFRWEKNGQLFSTLKTPLLNQSTFGWTEIKLVAVSEFNCNDTFVLKKDIKPGVLAKFGVGLACRNDSTVFTNKTLSNTHSDVSYSWNFGDQSESKMNSPKHFYNNLGEHMVMLEARKENGCSSIKDSTVVVRVDPSAFFEVSDVCAGEAAVFINKSKLENKILNYSWSFGDGNLSTNHSPTHLYNDDGTTSFLVYLKVFVTESFCKDEYSKHITVNANPSCLFSAKSLSSNLSYQFAPQDSNLSSTTWSFQGGGSSSERNPTHTFQQSGSYLVTLFAQNELGCTCESTIKLNVGSDAIHPVLKNGVVLYPNPSSHSFYVKTTQPYNPLSAVKVYNLLGQEIEVDVHTNGSEPRFDLENAAPGLYFVALTINNQLIVSPLRIVAN